MKIGFLRLLDVLLSSLPKQIVPADVAPPPAQTAALALGVVIVLGVIVVVIVVISILVIRAIRRKNTPRD